MKARPQDGDSTGMKTLLDVSQWNDDSTLTVEEVAAWLRMTPSWVRDHANGRRRPHLPSEKMGQFRRFRWGTLKQWRKELRG